MLCTEPDAAAGPGGVRGTRQATQARRAESSSEARFRLRWSGVLAAGVGRELTEIRPVQVLVVHVFAEPLAESQRDHGLEVLQPGVHRGRGDRDQREELDAAP